VVTPATQPASQTPYRVKESNSEVARKLRQRVREGALWPADRHTAEFCGVPFVDVQFVDGEWVAPQPVSNSGPESHAQKKPSKSESAKSIGS
jgi:hypothetical protein